MTGPPVGPSLRLEPLQTVLSWPDGGETRLAVGVRQLARTVFRHEPPAPHELEQAIDRVEDALGATGLRHAARGDLWTDDVRLAAIPGLEAAGARLGQAEVEALFQRLASAALGHPGALRGLPADGEAAAALLVLRECLHHLGFDGVRRTAEGGGRQDAHRDAGPVADG